MPIHIMGKGIKKYRKSDKKTLSDIKDFLLLSEIRKFVSYSIKPTIHMATNDMIVAVELGSSKISGAVGRKRADGSLQVLAYASEPVAGFVRRGVVYNIDQTAQCLSNLINRLEPELGNYTIDQLYVGVGGYTLHSERNTVARSFEEETRVTDTLVDEMEEENAGKQYPGYGMMLMVSQEYKIGNNLLNDPVGVNCTMIEGNYLNILTRTSVMHNMAKSFEIAKINIADTAIPPLVAANVLLTDSERRQGCALIDFGAETTTISIHKGGNLRFLTVIPIGSQNITRDLCSLQLDEEEAERLKREHGLQLPASSDETIALDDSRSIELRKVYDVIEARFEEIILNVCHQIEASGYGDKQLLAGVVCCGGGINLKGFAEAVAKKTQLSKVRLACNTVAKVEWSTMEQPENGTQGVLVGLLMDGTENCCQSGMQVEISAEDAPRAVTGNLFTDDGESAQAQRDEELRQLREQKIKEAEARKIAMQAEKQKNSGGGFFSGIVKRVKSMGDNIDKLANEFLNDDKE